MKIANKNVLGDINQLGAVTAAPASNTVLYFDASQDIWVPVAVSSIPIVVAGVAATTVGGVLAELASRVAALE